MSFVVKIVPIGHLIDISVNGEQAGSVVKGTFYDTTEIIAIVDAVAQLCGATVVKA